ncbi:mandelate racemase/muconate lactonizing protein [Iocasia frigidifontis]|uniref:Mandelate racemase/muconate lactonizing protein n=1 Tax=Iocasia fonsfrigidae TaxID=2682810 RepID=A0A8A7K6X4_9FIRM|nr:mandelate racemase/muconate lactonizing protein [Iocasia fonsfrigidae]
MEVFVLKITDLYCIRYEGSKEKKGEYYEERLVRPVDIYEEFRSADWSEQTNLPVEREDSLLIRGIFLYIETDIGIKGIFGPLDKSPALIVLSMKELLIGQNPLATQKLWDLMYRSAVHGRKGISMMAISAIDCALWDLKGKYFDQPVYRLLGGPVREKLPVYASMLGFSLEPELVKKRVKDYRVLGFAGQKWFFRHGPASGQKGFENNLELVQTAREAAGDNYNLIFDAWMGWDVSYTLRMIKSIEKYQPLWLEEPLMADKLDRLKEITANSSIDIAGGEHEYTRWGFQEIMKKGALNIIQPDTMWAGGITEMMNICSLASVYDIPLIPHGESFAANIHLTAAQSPALVPLVEYLVKWNEGWQYFLKDPITVKDGFVKLDHRPGLGLVIDDEKVENEVRLKY